MSIQTRNVEFRPNFSREHRTATPPQRPVEIRSPFGEDSVSISAEAYQVAEVATPTIHWNTRDAIYAANNAPGQPQRYQHSPVSGTPGTVTSVNGVLVWDDPMQKRK